MSSAGEILLRLPTPIDLLLTVASHGWAHLAPWRWDPEHGILARQEWIGSRLGTIAVAQRDGCAIIIRCDGFRAADDEAIQRRVRRWLSADWEPAEAIGVLGGDAFGDEAALIHRGGGRSNTYS